MSAIAIVNRKNSRWAHSEGGRPFGSGFAPVLCAPNRQLQAFPQCELRFLTLGSERSTHSHLLGAECA